MFVKASLLFLDAVRHRPDAPLNLQAHWAFLVVLSTQLDLEVVIQLLCHSSLSRLTEMRDTAFFFITKLFNIFGEKFSCAAQYDGVTKCRIYLARAVDKLRAVGNTASLSSDYLKYG